MSADVDAKPQIQHGVNGRRVVWPSGAVVSVRSPRMTAATLALFSASDDCPRPIEREEFEEFQRAVMEPLRAELRAAVDEALTAVLAVGDPGVVSIDPAPAVTESVAS